MFDIHQFQSVDPGDFDEDAIYVYIEELFEQFMDSPEGEKADEQFEGLGWADTFMDMGWSYTGATVASMSVDAIEEIVFDLFPRKISTDPESAREMIGELRAFWKFLQRQYQLPNAAAALEVLGGDAVE